MALHYFLCILWPLTAQLVHLEESAAGTKMASGSFTDYSTLKSDLEQTIKSMNCKDEDVVELDDVSLK